MVRAASLGVGAALSLVASAGAERSAVPRGMRPYLVAISVADVDASVAWYERVLGLSLVERKAFAQQGIRVAFLKSDGFRLELVELKNSINPATCADVSNPAALRGFGKFAFQVDDLAEVVKSLERHGVGILHDFRSAEASAERSIIVKDVDGNWLEFFQRTAK